ncbi:hypothetical protein AB6B24_10420 [Lactococcus sp. AK05]|uniref:hypothetical protein n=1 Tax=Lactococcus sp. AK05 TaxID=3239197 RepID=UPI0034DF5436
MENIKKKMTKVDEDFTIEVTNNDGNITIDVNTNVQVELKVAAENWALSFFRGEKGYEDEKIFIQALASATEIYKTSQQANLSGALLNYEDK